MNFLNQEKENEQNAVYMPIKKNYQTRKKNRVLRLKLNDLLLVALRDTDVTLDQVMSYNRKRTIVTVRQHFFYLSSKFTRLPACEIGRFANGRNHATVLYGINIIKGLLDVDQETRDRIEQLEMYCEDVHFGFMLNPYRPEDYTYCV